MFEVIYINNNKKIYETYQELIEDKNFNNIIKLDYSHDKITSLYNLTAFNEGVRNPTELDFLPAKLKKLYCSNNQLTSLDNLTAFDEGVRNPTELDFLPNSLKTLYWYNNPICEIVNNYFDKDLEKYNLWKQKNLF